ncbi:MAG: chromate transporter [Pseudanabaena sp. SU_2_4]|nr:chromate transporter [Pseudanabaena sp. SU_2_4]
MTNNAQLEPKEQRSRLLELAVVFSKLGITAFGGPAAHIAMMDDEVVKRRQWMSREQLLDLLGITNLIPGPNSTELAIHIGLERAGWMGLLVAGTCFILPAMLIVWALAIIYEQYQTVPQVGWLLYGVKPVAIAIILQALWKLGKSAIKNGQTLGAGIIVVVLSYLGVNEILLLLLAGLVVMLISGWKLAKTIAMRSYFCPYLVL